MTMPKNLVVDFFKRTIKNLQLYDEYHKHDPKFEYEVTQLINSFLGLIVFVLENYKKASKTNTIREMDKPVMREMLLREVSENQSETIIEVPIKFTDEIYDKFKDKIQSNYHYNDRNTEEFLNHLRNSISHGRIELLPNTYNPEKIGGIKFQDENKEGTEKFEITLNLEEIRDIIDLIEKHVRKIDY